MILFLIHPSTLIVLVYLIYTFRRHKLSSAWWLLVSLPILFAVLKPLLWWYGMPALYGWRLSELGGYIYMHYVLPINGFATGLLLGAAVSPRTSRRRVIFYTVLGCAALLIVELALLGSLSGFAGNLGRSR